MMVSADTAEQLNAYVLNWVCLSWVGEMKWGVVLLILKVKLAGCAELVRFLCDLQPISAWIIC